MIKQWTGLLLLCYVHWSVAAPKADVHPEDVIVVLGESVVINCTLPINSTDDSSQLYFKLAPPRDVASSESTSVLDTRTVQFRVDRAGLNYDNVHALCYLRAKGAVRRHWQGSSTIHVGKPPEPIRDFQCVSPNWARMLCTWNCSLVPGHAGYAYHFIRYGLNYTLNPNLASGWKKCPKFSRQDDERCQCLFEVFSEDFRRYDEYAFRVRAWSEFGEVVNDFSTTTIRIVRPDPVSALVVTNVTATSLTVKWRNPPRLEHTIRPLTYQLRSHSDYGTKLMNLTDCENECRVWLSDLMPYTNYTISVRSTTRAFPTYWSAWQVVLARTAQSVPERSPEMSSGAYMNDTTLGSGSRARDIDLYFKDVPHEFLNGQLVDMKVVVHDVASRADTTYDCATTMRLRYCKVFQLDCSRDYVVSLLPKTSIGFSREGPTSSFHLAPCGRGPPHVEHFVGEIYESDLVESTIRFTWKLPAEPTNLTLYYCASTNCESGLEWQDIEADQTSLNLTVSHPRRSINDLKFSVASRSEGGSRGMTNWMTCLYDWDGEPGLPVLKAGLDKLQSPESLLVEIVAPECQKGSGRVLQYWLHYALASDLDSGNNETIELGPYETGDHQIGNLVPNTKYVVSLTAVGRSGEKQIPAIIMMTAPPSPLPSEIVAVVVIVCLASLLIFICLMYRLYRLRETPIEIKLPIDDTERELGDRAEAEEELLHDLMCETSLQHFRDLSDYDVNDDTQRKLLPNGNLAENGVVKQRSRDSGNGSLLSDANNHDHVTVDPGLSMVQEDLPMQFVQGPDDYVLQVHIPTAYENKHYSASVPIDGEVSPLSSEPVSPGSDSLASNEASSSQGSDSKVPVKDPGDKKSHDSESDSYWQVGMKQPTAEAASTTIQIDDVVDDNGNRTPVNVARDSRDNGYGSTTPNDASLTNCEDSDSGSQYSLDSGHSLNSERTPRFPSGPMVLNGDYVIRPDSLEPKRPVNSCGETSEDTDNSETGQDSYAKVGLSPEAIDSRVLGLTDSPTKVDDAVIPLDTKKEKPFKPVTLDPATAIA